MLMVNTEALRKMQTEALAQAVKSLTLYIKYNTISTCLTLPDAANQVLKALRTLQSDHNRSHK